MITTKHFDCPKCSRHMVFNLESRELEEGSVLYEIVCSECDANIALRGYLQIQVEAFLMTKAVP